MSRRGQGVECACAVGCLFDGFDYIVCVCVSQNLMDGNDRRHAPTHAKCAVHACEQWHV